METYALLVMGIAALVFIGVGIYLHFLRAKAEESMPAPFTNPRSRRKPKKARS